MRTGRIPGFLDDHGALLVALIDLYETDFDLRWLREARDLARKIVALFDGDGGPLYFTGSDGEALVVRSRKLIGGAEPSGNALVALGFARLASLAGDADRGALADAILGAYAPLLERAPRALGLEAVAGAWRTGPTQEIGFVADDPALLAEVRRRLLPFAVVARIDGPPAPVELPWMGERFAVDGRPTAWVCIDFACKLPATDVATLASQLDEATSPPPPPADRGRVRAPELPQDPAAWVNTDRPLRIADLRGSVVVLDFWTFCCINCMHVLPELQAIEERFAGRPVVVIGVHSAKFTAEQHRERVALAVERHHVRHAVVNDPGHDVWDQYAVRSWPTLVLVDTEGRVAWHHGGEVGRDELGRRIEALLAEAGPSGLGAAPAAMPLPLVPAGPLAFPGKVHVHGDRLYVADTGHHRVLEAELTTGPDGWPVARTIRAFGGPTTFQDPQGLSRIGDELWVADTGNHALRVVDLRTGAIRTAVADLRSPWDVVAVEGAVFVAMAGTHQIWVHLPTEGRTGPFVGSGAEDHVDGPPDEAALAQPSGLALAGRFLVWADSETSSVRLMDLEEREVSTVVGRGLFDFGDQDGPLEQAMLQHPLGIAAAATTLYVADTFNDKVKAIDLQRGTLQTLAAGLLEPGGLAVHGDRLIVADTGHHRLVAVDRTSGELRELYLASPGMDSP